MHLIRHLSRIQSAGISFIWGTFVSLPLTPHVYTTMGPSKVLNEPKCGSGAHRPLHVWKNSILYSALESTYRVLPSPRTMDNILAASGLEGWRRSRLDTQEETAPPYTQHYRASAQERPRTPPRPTVHAPRRDYSTRKGPSPYHPRMSERQSRASYPGKRLPKG